MFSCMTERAGQAGSLSPTDMLGCLMKPSRKKDEEQSCEDYGPMPVPAAVPPAPRKPALRMPVKRGSSAGGQVMVVLQDFLPTVEDEVKVTRGERVRLLYQDGDWAYVCVSANRVREVFGFIPARYCRPLTVEEIESSQRRMVTFAVDHLNALDLASPTQSDSSSVSTSYRASPLPTANPYHMLATYSKPSTKKPSSHLKSQLDASKGGEKPLLLTCDAPSSNDTQKRSVNPQPYVRSQSAPNNSYPYKAAVLYSFNADGSASAEHARVLPGDTVLVLGKDGPDWVWVLALDGSKGLLPSCFVKKVAQRTDGDGRGVMEERRRSQPESLERLNEERTLHHQRQVQSSSYSRSLSEITTSAPHYSIPHTMELSQWLDEDQASNANHPPIKPTMLSAVTSPPGGEPPSPDHSSADSGFFPSPNSRTASTLIEGESVTTAAWYSRNVKPEMIAPEHASRTNNQMLSRSSKQNGVGTNRSPVDELAARLVDMATVSKATNAKCSPSHSHGCHSSRKSSTGSPGKSSTPSGSICSFSEFEDSDCVQRCRLMMAMSYEATGETQLSVDAGETVYGDLDSIERGWLWVRVPRTGASGFVPASYTCRLEHRRELSSPWAV